jgi:SAM-dependent methyltransferase
MVGPVPIGGFNLNLGAGKSSKQPGLLNCDLYPGPNIDVVFDLTKPWPFPEHSVATIYLCHVLEHLTDPKAFFREAHRCLRPNGTILIRVPYGAHRAAWWDLEHVRPWFAENFAMLQPGYAVAVGNPQHDSWKYPFGISIVQLRISYRLARWLRRWWWKWLFAKFPHLFDPEIEELWAHLYALKTDDAIQYYRKDHDPIVVGTTYSAYQHHLTDKAPEAGVCVLTDLIGGITMNGYIGRVFGLEKA